MFPEHCLGILKELKLSTVCLIDSPNFELLQI